MSIKKEGESGLGRTYQDGVSCYRLFRESNQDKMPKKGQFPFSWELNGARQL